MSPALFFSLACNFAVSLSPAFAHLHAKLRRKTREVRVGDANERARESSRQAQGLRNSERESQRSCLRTAASESTDATISRFGRPNRPVVHEMLRFSVQDCFFGKRCVQPCVADVLKESCIVEYVALSSATRVIACFVC